MTKYRTTLHRSSYDVINIIAISSHGISLKKNYQQRGTWTCVAGVSQQPCNPLATPSASPKKEASSPERATAVSPIRPCFSSHLDFYDINFILYPKSHVEILWYKFPTYALHRSSYDDWIQK